MIEKSLNYNPYFKIYGFIIWIVKKIDFKTVARILLHYINKLQHSVIRNGEEIL